MSSPNISAIVSFSRELRNAREFKSISLAQIEATTRVVRQHLEALESAHWDEIPDGFLRGYLALYASAVGMNTEKVLRDFDELSSPTVADNQARIVSNKPLLHQPEQVGLTRAKITAAWFADLASRTYLRNILLLLAITLIVFGPAWIRSSLRPEVPETIPISLAMNEYAKQTHGPQTTIPLDLAETIGEQTSATTHWLTLKTFDKGQIIFVRDLQDFNHLRFSLLETINIQYVNDIAFEIKPSLSANFTVDDTLYTLDTSRTDISTLYHLSHNDLLSLPPDTVLTQSPAEH